MVYGLFMMCHCVLLEWGHAINNYLGSIVIVICIHYAWQCFSGWHKRGGRVAEPWERRRQAGTAYEPSALCRRVHTGPALGGAALSGAALKAL